MTLKTKINIANIGLNEFFDRKSDIVYGLFHALSDLGYDVIVTHNSLSAKCYNLIIGSDILAGDESAVNNIIHSKFDYAIYEVENFNGKTVNYRRKFDIENYKKLLSNSNLVITPYKFNLPHLQAVCGEKKVVYARWGYHNSMIINGGQKSGQHHYDGLFIGLIKGARVAKYHKLSETAGGKVLFIDQEHPFTFRNFGLLTSRYGLALSYGETDNFVNPFRLYLMAANGLPILADHTVDDDNYLDICECMPFEEIQDQLTRPAPRTSNILERCNEMPLTGNLKGVI